MPLSIPQHSKHILIFNKMVKNPCSVPYTNKLKKHALTSSTSQCTRRIGKKCPLSGGKQSALTSTNRAVFAARMPSGSLQHV